jgi:hypothetical protein
MEYNILLKLGIFLEKAGQGISHAKLIDFMTRIFTDTLRKSVNIHELELRYTLILIQLASCDCLVSLN